MQRVYIITVWKHAIHPKKGWKIFPPLKLNCYSWPRCGSLIFVAINRTTGYREQKNYLRKYIVTVQEQALPDPRLHYKQILECGPNQYYVILPYVEIWFCVSTEGAARTSYQCKFTILCVTTADERQLMLIIDQINLYIQQH